MPEHRRKAEPHRRTRTAHQSETAEDYVETIAEILQEKTVCRLADLSRRFGVSNVTAHRIIERLQREGLVISEPYQPVTLTAQGQRLAARCRKRHEVVYQFLTAIGVDPATAAIEAEGIEHHVGAGTLQKFEEMTRTLRSDSAGSASSATE